MPTGYSIKLTAISTYTFDISPRHDISQNNDWDERGKLNRTDVLITLIGYVQGVDAPDTLSKYLKLLDFTAENSKVDVEISFNAVLQKAYRRADFVTGPHIKIGEPIPEEGQGGFFYRFKVDIFGTKGSAKDTSGSATGVKDIFREVRRRYFNRRLTHIGWVGQATGEAAVNLFLGAAPAGFEDKALRRSEISQIDDGKFQVDVSWDRWQTEELIEWKETIDFDEGGPSVVEIPNGADLDPMLWPSRRRAMRVRISGHVMANKKDFKRPDPPLTAGREEGVLIDFPGTMSDADPYLAPGEDGIAGIYRWDYRWSYVVASATKLAAQLKTRPEPASTELEIENSAVSGFPNL